MIPIKQYINELMNDKRRDPLSGLFKLFLLAFSYIYAFLAGCHHFFYEVNLLKSYKPRIFTVSVGNITLGGTGKTPFVIMLAEQFLSEKKKPAILIRGYGEDEWSMLRERLGSSGVNVFVGRDRVKTAREAEKENAGSIILDDGFQHRRLGRDIDIVLLDSANPFGNRHLFPRGILREPPGALKRADIIVLTKVDRAGRDVLKTSEKIEKIAPGKPIIKAVHRARRLSGLWKKDEVKLAFLEGKRLSLLSAICDASYFRHTIEASGGRVDLEFVFPDHHVYTPRDLERILRECEKKGIDAIVTTEKDAVKLRKLKKPEKGPGILVLAVELEITEGKEALRDVVNRLHMRYSRQNS